MTTRIVVGAAGFIGSAIVRHVGDGPDPLIEIDRKPADEHESRHADPRRESEGSTISEVLKRLARPGSRIELIYAAGTHPPLRSMDDTSPAEVESALDDAVQSYAVMRAFAHTVAARRASGSIVFISTVGATRPHRYLAGYDAARAAVESIVRSIAIEYGRRGITARTLAVGPIRESSSTRSDGDLGPALVDLVPTGKYASVADIASIAVAFAGPAFDCANGHTLTVDGGLTVQLRPSAVERGPQF
jgi:gluconate 5-dehydrogenase